MGWGIQRFLPNNEYLGTTNSATQATSGNPFVTVADLPAASGNGIYDGSGTSPSATIVSLTDYITILGTGLDNGILNIDAADSQSDSELNFQNGGTNMFSWTYDGGLDRLLLKDASGTTIMNVRDDETDMWVAGWRFGVGTNPSSSKFLVRGEGVDITTSHVIFENSVGQDLFDFKDSGLLLAGMNSVSTGAWGTAHSISSKSLFTDTTGLAAGIVSSLEHNPTGSGSTQSFGVWTSNVKNGNFNASMTIGMFGEGRNVGSGNLTTMLGGFFQVRNDSTGSITSMFGAEVAFRNFGNATITDFGGLRISNTAMSSGTITHSPAILVESPSLQTGGTIANTYVLKAEDNAEGTNNWGLHLEGATWDNYIAGNLSVGASTIVNSVVEVTGDIEIIGSPNSLIVEDRNNPGDRYECFIEDGVWTTDLLP